MLFYLYEYLQSIDFPGVGMFQYITFRSGLAIITALLIGTVFGKRVIRQLQKQQVGEVVRDLGLEGQYKKKGTPTMGGIIIIISILIPVLLFGRLDNVYILLMIFSTVWLGIIGFVDDYIKVFKKNKEGLAGRFKILGQIVLGLIVGLTLYFNDDVVARLKTPLPVGQEVAADVVVQEGPEGSGTMVQVETIKAPVTNVPFFKNNRIDYSSLLDFLGDKAKPWGWVL